VRKFAESWKYLRVRNWRERAFFFIRGDDHGRNRTGVDREVADATAREERAAAGARLGKSLARLDALNLPPLSDEEIAAEIQAARQDRAARPA